MAKNEAQADSRTAQMMKDEQGRPFIIVREYVITRVQDLKQPGFLLLMEEVNAEI